jgi:hypothetical protein
MRGVTLAKNNDAVSSKKEPHTIMFQMTMDLVSFVDTSVIYFVQLKQLRLKGTISWDISKKFWQEFAEWGPTKGNGWIFFCFFGAPMILMQKVYCCASLRWLNNVSCLFLSFLLITSGVKSFIDKSWLAWCLYCTEKSSWRCIGPLVAFLRHCRKIFTILQPMGRSKETWTK